MLAGGAGGGECWQGGVCLMSWCLTGKALGEEFPPGFLFLLRLCCPLVENVNFVSVLRTVMVSSPFCRVET